MALTNASRLADFGTGIGTQGAILQVDNADQMVGIGTTDPTAQLEVKQDFKVGGASTITGALTVSGDLTASGNVTIGGTLTYEDVTNIDSVGLITARTGVRVTAGGVVVTAGVSTFTDDVKVNSTLTATEGINVTAGVTTIAGTSTFAKATTVNATLTASEGINVSAGVGTFAGNVSIADKIIHTGDTDTAIRFSGADTVKIETAGSNRFQVNDNGKIGVGVDPTAYPGKFIVGGAAGGASGILCDREIISRVASGIANTERGFQQITDGVEKLAVYVDNGSAVRINNDNGSERVCILGNGRVGIGTSAADAKLEISDATTGGTSGTGEEILLKLQGRATKNVYLDINADADRRGVIRFKSAGTDKWSIGRGDSDEVSDSSFMIATGSSGGNTAKLIIDSSGRVLLGQSSADADIGSQLQVVGTSYAAAGILQSRISADQYGPALDFLKTRNTSWGSHTIVQDDDQLGRIYFRGDDGVDYGNAGALIMGSVDGTPGSDDMPGRLTFHTSGDGSVSVTERLRIDCRGFVGIGEDNPDELLHLSANNTSVSANAFTSANNTLRFTDTDTTVTSDQPGGTIEWETLDSTAAGVNAYIGVKNSNTGYSSMVFGTGNESTLRKRLTITQEGHILTHAATDMGDLTIRPANNEIPPILTLQRGDDGSGVSNGDVIGTLSWSVNDGTYASGIQTSRAEIRGVSQNTSSAARLEFWTGNTTAAVAEAMRIIGDKSIYIHTTTAVGAGVNGVEFHSPNAAEIRCGIDGTGNSTQIRFYNDNGEVGAIRTNGSATTYNTSSDYRLKENATAITDGITRLKTLKPYRFNFKAGVGTTVDGFFAHEVTAVPEAITGTKDQVATADDVKVGNGTTVGDPLYQSIDKSKLVPLLTAALQEAITKIETLEARLDAAGL